MRKTICETASEAAVEAARLLAGQVDRAVAARARASIALSGGTTPARMHAALAKAKLDWPKVHVFQVDERVIDDDDERSNIRAIRAALADTGLPTANLHALRLDRASPERIDTSCFEELRAIAGTPPVLDAVHLGLGEDGHTASLFPGDSAVDATGEIVMAGKHAGLRRMTLTLEVINRARMRIWLVTGTRKRAVVQRLLESDSELLASRVRADGSVLVLDRAAAGEAP